MDELKTAQPAAAPYRPWLVAAVVLIVGYLYLTRYEFLVIPPGGKGEYGILVRVHKYAGTAEIALPLSRVWTMVVDSPPPGK